MFAAYYNRGVAYWYKHDADKTITDLTDVIRLNPKLGVVYFNRGLAYQKKGDNAKAEEDFTQAKKLGYKEK